MGNDRTGGSRRKARVNPPVVHFSGQFTPKSEAPAPYEMGSLGRHAVERGFLDGGTDQAKYILDRIGYQHASAYFDLFKNADGEIGPDASMKELHKVILFDRKFQALLMEYIGLFELQFRAQYAYLMSLERGAFAHRNPRNFKDEDHFAGFLKRYEDEFNRQLKKGNRDLSRAYEEYGDAPTWLAVEIMSFGTLSMLFNNTKSKAVRNGVAQSFGTTAENLVSWTRAISGVRNTCAHFGRLCGTKLSSRPKMLPGVPGDNGNPMYIVPILMSLLNSRTLFPDDTSLSYGLTFVRDAMQLFCDFEDILSRCRIPRNWEEMIYSKEVFGASAIAMESMKNRKPGRRLVLKVAAGDKLIRI
ncbi:MAG: Abi family protein [Eggerthellaceae bacterium]|jgi:abortive infection bacteriophage resistance protein|nr:Abi family protein [Eggerthellaceae bacterium]